MEKKWDEWQDIRKLLCRKNVFWKQTFSISICNIESSVSKTEHFVCNWGRFDFKSAIFVGNVVAEILLFIFLFYASLCSAAWLAVNCVDLLWAVSPVQKVFS